MKWTCPNGHENEDNVNSFVRDWKPVCGECGAKGIKFNNVNPLEDALRNAPNPSDYANDGDLARAYLDWFTGNRAIALQGDNEKAILKNVYDKAKVLLTPIWSMTLDGALKDLNGDFSTQRFILNKARQLGWDGKEPGVLGTHEADKLVEQALAFIRGYARWTAWTTEQRQHEINRLEGVLRDMKLSLEEKQIATTQLEFWKQFNMEVLQKGG